MSFDRLLVSGEFSRSHLVVRGAYMRPFPRVADISSPSSFFLSFPSQYAYNPNRRASATPVQRSQSDANAFQQQHQQQQQQHQVVQLPPLLPRNPSRLGHHSSAAPIPSRSQATSRASNQATAGGGPSIRAMATPSIQHRPTSVVQSHRRESLLRPDFFYSSVADSSMPAVFFLRLLLHPNPTSVPSSTPSTSASAPNPQPTSSSSYSSSLHRCSNALLPQRKRSPSWSLRTEPRRRRRRRRRRKTVEQDDDRGVRFRRSGIRDACWRRRWVWSESG